MAAIIAKALGLATESDTTTGFVDDENIPAWAKGAVAAIKKVGIMEGTGANQFNSYARATRAEAVTTLLRMLSVMNK